MSTPAEQTHSKATTEEEPDPPRNFTAKQLRNFDGTKDVSGDDKPVYLSVNGTVFDVSDGRDFYGPGKRLDRINDDPLVS